MSSVDPITTNFELDLIRDILLDPLKNHQLTHLVKDIQVTVLEPESIEQLPFIRLIPLAKQVNIDDDIMDGPTDPLFGDQYDMDMEVEIVMGRNQELSYNGAHYNNPYYGLTVLANIVDTTIRENKEAQSDDGKLQLDDVKFLGGVFLSPYITSDYVGIALRYTLTMEKDRAYD